MKVFISHKQEDTKIANDIIERLKLNSIDAYLDVLDDVMFDGEILTNHIKDKMSTCTDILVVISNLTAQSWWVPFEIGVASEKNFPIVNFIVNGIQLPDYLSYWPQLTKLEQIDNYVKIKKLEDLKFKLSKELRETKDYNPTNTFYRNLKESLRSIY